MRASGIAIFVLLFLFVGCSPETPEGLTAKAEKAYASKDYPRAIAAYEALLQIVGEEPTVYRNLALAAYGAQDTTAARQAAEHCIALTKDSAEADACRELLGMIAEDAKAYNEAIKYYREAVNSTDVALRVRVLSRLAQVYTQTGRADGALGSLLTALLDAPQDAPTLYNLGLLCVREPLMLRRASYDFFSLAVRLLPEGSSQLRDARNWCTRLEKNFARLQQVPPLVGNKQVCREAMAQAKEKQNKRQWRAAETLLDKAVKADPTDFNAALALGRMCAKNNHREAALQAYGKAIALREDSVEARSEAAQLAYDAKQYNDALNYLRPAMVAQRRNRYLADLFMRILTAKRKLPDARVWGEYYLRLNPSAPESYKKWVQSLPEA